MNQKKDVLLNQGVLKPTSHYSFLVKDNIIFVLMILMIFSYFYNLPIVGYSLKGDNELRLYDILGVFVFYVFFANINFYYYVIKKVKVFKWFFNFCLWCSLTILVTFIYSIFKDKFSSFLQSVLYLYHLWVFFITSIIFFVICYNRSKLKILVYTILLLSVISCTIIILQNFEFLPFFWSNAYKIAYQGFLSGTLGPNKIVTGMFSVIISIFSIGLFSSKNIGVNKLFLLFVISINIYIIILTGSRTSYVGLLVFLVFFAFFKTSRFIFFGIFIGSIFVFLILSNDDLFNKIDEVINNRVVSKIENEEDLQNADVGKLYEDLGAGRSQISAKYSEWLLENPEIIPFGLGFNNRLVRQIAAHNMYLTVIKELGLVGFVLYFGWLIQYIFIPFKKYGGNELALKGLALSMLVTLFFGEHLYIYRPIFAVLGMFLIVMTALLSYLHENES
jgi:hypothetical protein